jgi:hypothetical protein
MKKSGNLITVAAALLLASCSQDELQQNNNSGVEVQFTSGNIATVQTRTSIDNGSGETQWSASDFVGIFMTGSAIANNKKYLASTAGILSADGNGNQLFYPPSGNVDFIAYYPWKNGQTLGDCDLNVTAQTDPAEIDLLYSNNATSKNKTSGTVTLDFVHALSKLKLTVTKDGAGVNSLLGLAVNIRGMNRQARINLANGSISSPSDVNDVVPLVTQTPDHTTDGKYEAILIPGDITDATVEFSINGGDTYIWNIGTALGNVLTGGKLYEYTVTLKKTGISVSSCTITPWKGTDGDYAGTGNALVLIIFNNVNSAAEWKNAINSINSISIRNYGSPFYAIINLTGDFSLPASGQGDNPDLASDVNLIVTGNQTISLTGTGNLFLIGSNSRITLDGPALKGVNNNSKGLVSIDGGSFTLQNGSIKDNKSSTKGGGVVISRGNFTMNGGTITNNTANSDGGGVSLANGQFTMTGGTITGNTARSCGGGLYIEGNFTYNGGTISGNTAIKGTQVYKFGSSTVTGSVNIGAGKFFYDTWPP